MTTSEKSMTTRPKQEMTRSEATEETFRLPYYETRESGDAFGLEVFLPGVARENLELNVEKNELRLIGRPTWQAPADWKLLYRETSEEAYRLHLELPESVDTEKIHAHLEHGILRLTLPKADEVRPRRIEIQ